MTPSRHRRTILERIGVDPGAIPASAAWHRGAPDPRRFCFRPSSRACYVRRGMRRAVAWLTFLLAASPHVARAAAGALDPSFGSGGAVVTPVGDSSLAQGTAVIVQPDGKVVLAGNSFLADAIYLVRYGPDGVLDPGFGTDGIVSTPRGNVAVNALVLQPDGKLVVAGKSG